jgi:hypothetical protein
MVRPPHTGIVYTPPDWSDHVAVSALLQLSVLPPLQLRSGDAATRECQPHAKQRKIMDLFARAGAPTPIPAPASMSALPEAPDAALAAAPAAAPAVAKKQKTAAAEKFAAFFSSK